MDDIIFKILFQLNMKRRFIFLIYLFFAIYIDDSRQEKRLIFRVRTV